MTERWEIVAEVGIVHCKLFRDDFQVYYFSDLTMHTAMERLPYVYRQLRKFNYTVHIRNRKDVHDHVIGREIYYREIPAIITDFDGEGGRVCVRSDTPARKGFPPEPWDGPTADNSQDVWEDLLSPKIYWHRESA